MRKKKNLRYMLDTNTVSYLMKGTKPNLKERLIHEPMSNLYISVITEAEIFYGLAKKPEAKGLQKAVAGFLDRVEVLPWDSTISKHYASLRVSSEASGTILGNLDLMIAAHSLAAEMILVTSDKAFYRVKGLALEDWTKTKS
jgi:tRNA(fMet)-specific endonuclease VapC